jgi:hypothetical protein
MADEQITLAVNGIVAARDKRPYVQISKDKEMIVQFTVAEARSFAHDLLNASHNAEADAMIIKFFEKLDLPPGALGAFMVEFRRFRYELETEAVQTNRSNPDTGEQIT